MSSALFPAYIVVWLIIAIGSWAYLRELDASAKKRQYLWVSLLGLVLIGGFLTLFPLLDGEVVPALFIVAFCVAIGYLQLTRLRLCEACNRALQPSSLFWAVAYCPRCGTKTVKFKRPFERDAG